MRCVLCAERWSRLQQPCQLCVECARVCWPLPTALSTAFFFNIKRVFPLTTAATKSSGLSQLFQSLKEGIRVCSHLQRALMLSRGREGFCSLADVQHPSRALQLRGSSWGCQWGLPQHYMGSGGRGGRVVPAWEIGGAAAVLPLKDAFACASPPSILRALR